MAALEPLLAPPVSVRLHGDFNTNNVVLDPATERVHFIDVHRSGPGDYAQDVGVLLVSNLRHPIQDVRIRAELARLNRLIEGFASEFAPAGERRALRRAPHAVRRRARCSRPAAWSRDPDFAREIYLHGVRLLERAAAVPAA